MSQLFFKEFLFFNKFLNAVLVIDNNVKIEMLRNELDLLRKNFVLCEQKLFDLKNYRTLF